MEANYVQQVIDRLGQQLDDCPPELIDLYTLLAITRGPAATLQDVHDAWAVWRNRSNPAHRYLIPFGELTDDVQELDRKYLDAIHAAAAVTTG